MPKSAIHESDCSSPFVGRFHEQKCHSIAKKKHLWDLKSCCCKFSSVSSGVKWCPLREYCQWENDYTFWLWVSFLSWSQSSCYVVVHADDKAGLTFILWLFHFATNPCLPSLCTFILCTLLIADCCPKVSYFLNKALVGGFPCSHCGLRAVGCHFHFLFHHVGVTKLPEIPPVSKSYTNRLYLFLCKHWLKTKAFSF